MLNDSKDLLEQYNKIRDKGYIADIDKNNDLSTIYLDSDEVDEVFLDKLKDEEKLNLVKGISIKDNSYEFRNLDKLKTLFKMQFELIKNKGGYTDDLEELFDTQFSTYKSVDCQPIDSFDYLKTHVDTRLYMLDKENDEVLKEPNGKIDADFKQGRAMGDCWVLASIKAMASDKKGLEKLNNMISVQKENGELVSVTVHLQEKDYVISKQELYAGIEYSTGDSDVRALEIAMNRYCIENGYGDISSMGGKPGQALAILAGTPEEVKAVMNKNPWEFRLNKNFEEQLKNPKAVGTIGGALDEKYAIDVKTGKKVKLIQFHEYTILSANKKWAYLINPQDTSQKLKIRIDEIRSTFAKGVLYDFDK